MVTAKTLKAEAKVIAEGLVNDAKVAYDFLEKTDTFKEWERDMDRLILDALHESCGKSTKVEFFRQNDNGFPVDFKYMVDLGHTWMDHLTPRMLDRGNVIIHMVFLKWLVSYEQASELNIKFTHFTDGRNCNVDGFIYITV